MMMLGQGFALQSLLVAHDPQLIFTDGGEISHRGNHSIPKEPAGFRNCSAQCEFFFVLSRSAY